MRLGHSEELAVARVVIYVDQGTDGDVVDPVTAEILVAQLRAHGKRVVYDRVQGADHSFNLKGKPEINGWQEQMERIIKWFLKSEKD